MKLSPKPSLGWFPAPRHKVYDGQSGIELVSSLFLGYEWTSGILKTRHQGSSRLNSDETKRTHLTSYINFFMDVIGPLRPLWEDLCKSKQPTQVGRLISHTPHLTGEIAEIQTESNFEEKLLTQVPHNSYPSMSSKHGLLDVSMIFPAPYQKPS